MTASVVLRERLAGLEFPTGSLMVPAYEDWIARDTIGAPPGEDGLLHPGWTLFGALRAAGFDLERIIQLCGASWDDGVVFGETSIEQVQPLRVGVEYEVNGSFLDVQRRTGRQIAEFDVVTYEVRIEHDGETVTRCVNSFVIPRRRTA
nr:hypothetical protein [Aeromicrobium sp.]